MGQYFMLVNHTRKEFVSPWEVGAGAKLVEWCMGAQAGLLPYLLRKSDGTGGGDIEPRDCEFAGRWAGEQVELVGDYDSSGDYEQARTRYKDISRPLAEEYNRFMGPEWGLSYMSNSETAA